MNQGLLRALAAPFFPGGDKMNKRKYKTIYGATFVAPTIIGLLILNIYPIFKTLLLSFSASTGFEEYVFSGLNTSHGS